MHATHTTRFEHKLLYPLITLDPAFTVTPIYQDVPGSYGSKRCLVNALDVIVVNSGDSPPLPSPSPDTS